MSEGLAGAERWTPSSRLREHSTCGRPAPRPGQARFLASVVTCRRAITHGPLGLRTTGLAWDRHPLPTQDTPVSTERHHALLSTGASTPGQS